MKLYFTKGACSLAPHIILRELNIDCDYVPVNLAIKKLDNDEDFYRINPKGAVPALLLDNGILLTENVVIQQYLADTYKATQLLPLVGDLKRYEVLMWLNFASTDLHKNFSPFFNSAIPENIKEQVYKPILNRKLEYLNQHLTNSTYAVGNEFTLADSYLFTALRWCDYCGVSLEQYPGIQRYFKQVSTRPSVQAALQDEGLI